MPYNVITDAPNKRIEHVTTAAAAMAILAKHERDGTPSRVVSVEGVELSADRLQFLAALEADRTVGAARAAAVA